jgi:hypothetical protein
MTDFNVVSQFYSHKLEQEASVHYQGDTGTVPASPIAFYRGKNGDGRMDRDETVSCRVSTGIKREYTDLASALIQYIRCYIGF